MLSARDNQGQRLPASVLETWLDLRALAWGQATSEPLDFGDLKIWLGKSRSTICGHLAMLREHFGQRYEVHQEKLVVYFEDGGEAPDARVQESGLVQNAGPDPQAVAPESPQNKASPDSRTLDQKAGLPSLKESLVKDSVVKNKRKRGVQKAGLQESGLDTPVGEGGRAPAVEAFRAVCNRYPDRAVWPLIEKTVGAEPANLERWQATARGWIAAGYSKVNVAGMLDWYRQGRTRNESRNNGSKRPSTSSSEPDGPLTEAQRIARRLSSG
jgi:hypothetical protein